MARNMATRAKPDGGALQSVVEKFIGGAMNEGKTRNVSPEVVIRERLASLSELRRRIRLADVIAAYWRGHDTGNEALKSGAVRWLRGEFSTKTEARQALGVRTIVDDENVYDVLKLLARFVKLAGYDGLLVCLDEMVNLYKLQNTRARNTNYERILTILNDSLQGTAVGMGFILCGTPEFLLDARRGLYSYEALQSRLAENRFAVGGLVDFSGPVLRLANLTRRISSSPRKLRHVFAAGELAPPDDGLKGFMAHCLQKIGRRISDPAGTITAFVNLLSVIEQNPGTDWKRRRQVETPRRGRTAHSTKSRRRQPPPQTPPRPGR